MTDWLGNIGDLGEAFEKAKAAPKFGGGKKFANTKIPDGTNHVFLITSAELDEKKPMAVFNLVIETHRNWRQRKYMWLGGDLQRPLEELLKVGVEITSKEDLETKIPAMVGMRVRGTVKNRPGKDFPDLYFNAFIDQNPIETLSSDPDTSFDFPEMEEEDLS